MIRSRPFLASLALATALAVVACTFLMPILAFAQPNAPPPVSPSDLARLWDFATAHKWIPLSAALVMLLVGAAKQGWLSSWLASKLPAWALPWLATFLGLLSLSSGEILSGVDWKQALAHGAMAGVLAVFGHEVGIEGARGGREIVPPAPWARPTQG